MSNEIIGALGIVTFLLLLGLGMPVAFAMGIVGFVGALIVGGFTAGLNAVGTLPYTEVFNWLWVCVPLFILMGGLAEQAGISKAAFDAANKWVGRFPGGLAMATIFACGAFSAASGSSAACAATMARVCVPEMDRYRYDRSFAAAVVAAGGTLDILIPPSINMVIYAQITNVSIGKMFMAGIVPGVLAVGVYSAVIWAVVKLKPGLARRGDKYPVAEMIRSLKGFVPALILFAVVMGGIYTGVFTPTEAGGLGAFAAFVMVILARRMNWKVLTTCMMDTGRTTSMVFLLIVGGMIFAYFMTLSRLPSNVGNLVLGLNVPPTIVIMVIIFIFLVLGTFMNVVGMMLLTVPIVFPVVMALHYDPIWFGIIVVRLSEIAMLSPPVAMNVFIVSATINEPVDRVYRKVIPFIIGDVASLVFLVAFPEISLLLPRLMYEK